MGTEERTEAALVKEAALATRKRLSEIAVMGKIEKLMEDLNPAQRRRVAFVFADQEGLRPVMPEQKTAAQLLGIA